MTRKIVLGAALMLAFAVTSAPARDWYVSASRGKGKKGTKKKPAKDLGNIIRKLKAGDVVHIAAGRYLGKGKCGVYVINVPVQIIGGYSDDFSSRDPWGEYKTIFTGDNKTKSYKNGPRLFIDLMKYRRGEMSEILVDGIVVDMGPMNRYKTDKKQMILRKACPKKKENPTPDRGGIKISVSRNPFGAPKDAFWKVTVQNCVVVNCAATQGDISVQGYRNTKVVIRNNLLVNNTGVGIYCMGGFHGSDGFPEFLVEDNTVVFTWKYDAYCSSFSGSSLKIDDDVLVTAKNNLFAFADRSGILKKGQEPLKWFDNKVFGNLGCDYYEASGDSKIMMADIEDEAEYIHEDSEGFDSEPVTIEMPEQWKKLYASRAIVDRNAVEADIKAANTKMNALRGMLGLPLQAKAIKGVEGDVWLPLLDVDSAIKVGLAKYGKYGCSNPALEKE